MEVNSNHFSNVACYLRKDTKQPLFQIAAIFAANINGSEPNRPIIYFNPQVDNLLNHTNEVELLQKKGIKVLLTLLGNHQNAGWACMTNDVAIQTFANQVVNTINQYHLDGVDIDDEYSTCRPNLTSLIKIARAIKTHPNFKGKLLTKALFSDLSYFAAQDKGNRLADFLDYGAEMSYWSGNFNDRLLPYVMRGMLKKKLMLGVASNSQYPSLENLVNFIKSNEYNGVMVYDITNRSSNYLNRLAMAEYRTTIEVTPKCLI